MNLREANDILQNPKEHWSHEIEEAKRYCIEAVKYLVNAADSRFIDEAKTLIKYLDGRIAAMHPDVEAMEPICGNCLHFDFVGRCTHDTVYDRFKSPVEDASSCECYSPYPKEDK